MIYRNIDKKVLDKILDKVNEMDLPILIEEGCLIDNYLIRNLNNRNQAMTLANGKVNIHSSDINYVLNMIVYYTL